MLPAFGQWTSKPRTPEINLNPNVEIWRTYHRATDKIGIEKSIGCVLLKRAQLKNKFAKDTQNASVLQECNGLDCPRGSKMLRNAVDSAINYGGEDTIVCFMGISSYYLLNIWGGDLTDLSLFTNKQLLIYMRLN